MYKTISSTQNPSIKKLLLLQEKSRVRKKEKRFVVEGIRELQLALKGGYEMEELYFEDQLFPAENINRITGSLQSKPLVTELSGEVYSKVAYRGSTEGVLGVFKAKDLTTENLTFENKDLLILVAEAPEKPGNIGALLRTADAAGVDAVLIANPRTDLFNPNIIRSSVGCVFTNQIATGSTSEIIGFLKKKKVAVYAAALQAAKVYSSIDFTGSCALVVGTEASGLSAEWLANATDNIKIPMNGEIDSMNVSVAAGILIFEAKRQRGF